MRTLSFKALLRLCMIFFVFFSKNVVIVASYDIETEIIVTGIGGQRMLSLRAAVDILKNRMINDTIASDLLKKMPHSNMVQNEALIAAYNEKIREKLREQEFAERERQKALELAEKEKLREQELAEREKQQAQQLAKAAGFEEEHHTLESLEKSLQAEHYAYGGHDSLSITNTAVAPSVVPKPAVRKQLIKILREYEEKIRKLEKEGGHASRQEILEGAVVGSSGNASLDMLLGSYYKTIADIEKQSQALAEIQRAFFEIQSLYKSALELAKKTDKEIAGPKGKKITEEVLVIEDDALGAVLALMEMSNELVSKYKKVKFEGIMKRMKSAASPEKRVTVLQSVFDDLYITPISDELMRLSNTEYLQQSLKFTTLFEQQISALKALGIYPEQDFVQITGVLSKATTKFLNDIKENDKQTYEEYLPLLEEEAKLLSAVEDFAQKPMTLVLLQEPMAFFLLSRPSQNLKVIPFSYIERVERELEYLTEKQKKALFAYLYFISFNFQEVSQKFLKNTLLSATPITPKDIADLIEIVKQDMKSSGQLKHFRPSVSDQGSLGKFSLRVRSLISGEAREKAIIEKFNTERQYLRNMLNGITPEKIDGYKTSNKIAAKQKDVISRIQALWDLVMTEDLPRCDLEKLLAFKEELLQLRNTLGENSELLTKLAVFKNVESLGSAALMVSEGDGEEGSAEGIGPDGDSSSAVLGIMKETISTQMVLKGLNAGLLADISNGLSKQLARKNSEASNIPLPPSAPLLNIPTVSMPLAPPAPSFAPPAPEFNLAEPIRVKVLSPAEQKAAAVAATQLQEITDLIIKLETMKDKLSKDDYEELSNSLEEAKNLNLGGKGAFASIKLRPIKKALQ